MTTPLYTTEERFNFVMALIKERKDLADSFRGIARKSSSPDCVEAALLHAEEAGQDAEMQIRTLTILFPERF